MKLITWNVNGIRAAGPKGLLSLVQDEKPDILCLQETKAQREQVSPELQNLGFAHDYWSSAKRKGYSGTATFCQTEPREIHAGIGLEHYDSEGRIVHTQHEHFELYNIYFPNGGSGEERHLFKQQFLRDLIELLAIKVKQQVPMIVVGDYNVAHGDTDVHDPVRLSKISGFLPEERAWFTDFVKTGFVDTYRHFHPEVVNKYTWWSYREFGRVNNRGWRIDYICVTNNLLPYIKSTEILDSVTGSDHCPVVAEFDFKGGK